MLRSDGLDMSLSGTSMSNVQPPRGLCETVPAKLGPNPWSSQVTHSLRRNLYRVGTHVKYTYAHTHMYTYIYIYI